MKIKNVSAYRLMMSIAISFGLGTASGQMTKNLEIGDPAPPVKYSKWIKGEPVNSLDRDQLYVLEFWATWCGPCRAAMPHLTELQKEYAGKAKFIGVGIWEHVPAGQPYESSLPSVVKFVKGNSANMGYAVIADNNEQFMGNKWMKAAGEIGIPSTFIVKNDKIIWIGHPSSLDSLLPKILDGSYDMQAFKVRHEKSAEAGRDQVAEMTAFFKPIQDAIEAKEYDKALELMDKGEKEQPKFKALLYNMRFGVLLNVSPGKAMEFAKEWQKATQSAPSLVLGEVYKTDGLSKDFYLWVAKNFEDSKLNTNAIILHALATCYAKGDDYKSAAVYEEKAVEAAKIALKEGALTGYITSDTITEYEKLLAEYKKKS
jgi:thiol-disulfide isomerase/thioredoxin